mgnify:CR=1 FL=1
MPAKTDPHSSASRELLEIDFPYPLVATGPAADMEDRLAAISQADLFGDREIADLEMADACLSGLWLRFDFLDRSHTISQDIKSATGSFWHGIMHRREPDWSNAKYWFRQVGTHEIFGDLQSAAREIIAAEDSLELSFQSLADSDEWDPFAFVDLCESASCSPVSPKPNMAGHGVTRLQRAEAACVQIQKAEWQLLFDWCFARAVGESVGN